MKIFRSLRIILPLTLAFFGVYCPSLLSDEGATRTLVVEVSLGDLGQSGGCPAGVFGDHWVKFEENAKSDSYDSRVGPYSESQGQEGHVASNINPNDSSAGVRLDNNAEVYGNIAVTTSAEDGDVHVSPQATFTGDIHYNSAPWELHEISMPGWWTEAGDPGIHGSYGSKPGKYEITNHNFIAYNNAEVGFDAGEYHFSNFELSNNVEFKINAGEGEMVEIYIETSVIFENNSELLPPIEFQGDATKLRIYFGGTTMIDLSNNVEFYGFIYAPHALIYNKNNDSVYGALIGKEVQFQQNAAVHYDKALEDQDFGGIFTLPPNPPEKTSWQEVIISE